MPALPDNVVLIGVDGGASEVRAHQILVLADEEIPQLALGPASASTCYERLAGFEPVPIAQQLVAFERQQIETREAEELQGELWIEAAASAIHSVASQAGARTVMLGMCMPGLKTADRRGIAVLRNGPRMPAFAAQLERELGVEGLRLHRPIGALVADGDACAWGERCDAHGSLLGVDNAYVLGAGTGLAEAFVLDGEIVGLDALRASLAKAWQMESRGGGSFEDRLSMRGLNERFARRAGLELPLSVEDVPEERAKHGDERAQEVLHEAAEVLAELLLERITALHAGRGRDARGRGGPGAYELRPGTLLQRIVLTQHLGRLYADPELSPFLRDRTEERLTHALERSGSLVLCTHYLDGSSLRPDLLAASTLRASPAIGAAAMALLATRAEPRSTHARG
jgi:predicted NBD/HSP70 family sugar kinase